MTGGDDCAYDTSERENADGPHVVLCWCCCRLGTLLLSEVVKLLPTGNALMLVRVTHTRQFLFIAFARPVAIDSTWSGSLSRVPPVQRKCGQNLVQVSYALCESTTSLTKHNAMRAASPIAACAICQSDAHHNQTRSSKWQVEHRTLDHSVGCSKLRA